MTELIDLYDLGFDNEYRINYEDMKNDIRVSGMLDILFKCLFNTTGRNEYLCRLVSLILNKDYNEIKDNIHLLNSEIPTSNITHTSFRCDIPFMIKNVIYVLESNNSLNKKIMNRNLWYAILLADDNNKGKENYSFMEIVVININNFAFKKVDAITDSYVQDSKGIPLIKTIKCKNIFIPLIRKKWYIGNRKELTLLEKYLLVLVEPKMEVCQEIAGKNKILNELLEEIVRVCRKETIMELYDKERFLREIEKEEREEEIEREREKYLSQGRSQGLSQGLSQGISQGIEQEKVQTAKNMLKESTPLEFISKITGLTLNKIESIKASMF